MLHFLGLYTPDPQSAGIPPSAEDMDKMRRFVEQAMHEGWLIQTGPLLRGANNARVGLADGYFTVTGGSSERHEMGFALLRANSREEIIEKTKTFLNAAGGGQAELIEIMAPPPGGMV